MQFLFVLDVGGKPWQDYMLVIKDKSNPMKYICSICNAHYKVEWSLQRHIKQKHTQKKVFSFTCQICGFQYDRNDLLIRHLNFRHRVEM